MTPLAKTSPNKIETDLAAVIAAVEELDRSPRSDQPMIRISVLRNYTVESMLPLLKHHCYVSGLQPVISVGSYDNIQQEILNEQSHIYLEEPDLIVVSVLLESLDPQCRQADWDPSKARAAMTSMLEELSQRSKAIIVANTFLPALRTENSLAAAHANHRAAKTRELNESVREIARRRSEQIFVVDWERILQVLGESRSLDHRFWYMFRSPFKKDFIQEYAAEIAKIGRALKGKAKKCLVLDCDNTLWGGVIGEDGIDGIALNPHEYPGRCYHDFQQAVLNLISQGVVVALCSKNNEEDVWDVLDNHPHSLLKRSHIAAWRINWQNKAENIAAMAGELNLGLDSFVFVDDSAVECQIVREFLSDVTVLQAPSKAYELPSLLYADGLFDTLRVSAEDSERTRMYVEERQRTDLKNQFGSIDEYLSSLDLKAWIHRATESEMPRVAQLTGKTNQFNLTTRRYTEAQIRQLAGADDSRVFTMAASDRFGDLGLIAVLIARRSEEGGAVDSLLMSCRALGRKLEEVFVDHCLAELEHDWKIGEWFAEYLPTKKNRQVAAFWESLGFEAFRESGEGKFYRLRASERRRPSFDYISISGE